MRNILLLLISTLLLTGCFDDDERYRLVDFKSMSDHNIYIFSTSEWSDVELLKKADKHHHKSITTHIFFIPFDSKYPVLESTDATGAAKALLLNDIKYRWIKGTPIQQLHVFDKYDSYESL